MSKKRRKKSGSDSLGFRVKSVHYHRGFQQVKSPWRHNWPSQVEVGARLGHDRGEGGDDPLAPGPLLVEVKWNWQATQGPDAAKEPRAQMEAVYHVTFEIKRTLAGKEAEAVFVDAQAECLPMLKDLVGKTLVTMGMPKLEVVVDLQGGGR